MQPRTFGSYRLEQRLGGGGMGEVWRASHANLHRPAAIKLIRPEMLGARDEAGRALLRKRFEREARAWSGRAPGGSRRRPPAWPPWAASSWT